MSVQTILKKLLSGQVVKGKSPNEVELASYQEEERRDKLKVLLGEYRKKKNQEMLFSNTLVLGGKSILEAEDILKSNLPEIKSKRILNHDNIFFH